jgi:DNA polymerase-3 subunit gamma/tau
VAASDASSESYRSLYRRYRPQRFSEVRGQDHVVLALRNAVRDGRVAHAYLFSGPRGTGKTSTARILAKALNCADPVDGEPCGTCDSCRDIARGASLDVHELDAASNNRVDDMRDLVSRASLASPGEWKVYIVDEVHMLSTAASNALLKTLEEPPARVVFVLATTDPQKVLPTIRSRTQHYEFHLLEPEVLSSLLEDIVSDAKLDLPAEGVSSAVRRGHGSARDAISALDQVAAAGVLDDDDRFVRQMVAAIAERDTELALRSVGEALTAGFDAARLASDLIEVLRGVFLSAVAPGSHVAAAAGPPSGVPGLGPARTVRSLEVLGAAIVDMRESLDARTTLEVALVRLTHPEVDDTTATLLDRLERLERRVQELADGAGASGPPRPSGGGPPAGPAPPGPAGERPALGAFRAERRPPAGGEPPAGPAAPGVGESAAPGVGGSAAPEVGGSAAPGVGGSAAPGPEAGQARDEVPQSQGEVSPVLSRDDIVTAWADHVLAKLRPRARAIYASGHFTGVEGSEVTLALPNPAHVEHARPLCDEVAGALSEHFGTRLSIRLVADADSSGTSGSASAGPAARADRRGEAEEVEGDLDDIAPIEAGGRQASSATPQLGSASWAESRLLEEFPGAEEVS